LTLQLVPVFCMECLCLSYVQSGKYKRFYW
jgi:hypothetical protein